MSYFKSRRFFLLLAMVLLFTSLPTIPNQLKAEENPPLSQPTVTAVTVSPSAITLQPGNSQIFLATVEGTNNPVQTVTWTISGIQDPGTAISAGGALTIASSETAATLTVTATSTADTTRSGTATVTVERTGTITFISGLGGRISGGSTGRYRVGDMINLSAIPDPGYRFDRWATSNGGTFFNMYNANTTFIVPVQATTVTAYFVRSGSYGNVSASSGSIHRSNPTENQLSVRKADFYVDEPYDIDIQVYPVRYNYSLRRIRCGSYTLVEDVDYYVYDRTYVISAYFLMTLGRGDKILTFDMDNGGSPQVIISMIH